MCANRSVKDLQTLLRRMRVDYRDCIEKKDLVQKLASSYGDYFGKTYTLEPTKEHKASMVFCHGLGDSGEGWLDFMRYKLALRFPHMRFVLPTAPEIPVTISVGMPMNAWYDITSISLEGDRQEDDIGIQLSALYIEHLIKAESDRLSKNGGHPQRVLLGGFSQGSAMSMFTMLTSTQPVCGVVCLSGYFPGRESALPQALKPIGRHIPLDKANDISRTPMFVAHGNADFVVPVSLSHKSVDFLIKNAGIEPSSIRSNYYADLAHSTNEEEERDIILFIDNILKRTN